MKKLVITGLALCLVSSAWAQQTAATPTQTVTDAEPAPDVVVTAARHATSVDATAASVTVVTRQDIEDHGDTTVVQALQSVPGLSLVTPGTPGTTTGVFTRGTGTDDTLVLVDGRRLPQDLSGGSDLTNMTTDDIECIEVVRGPSASLYGGNTIGGVINIVTRDGRGLAQPTYSVSEEAGSFSTFREAVASRGAAGAFDYSVEGSRLDTDFQRANNQYELSNVNSKFGVQASRDVYVDTLLRYNLSNAGDPGDSYTNDPISNLLRESWLVSPQVTWNTTDDWTQKLYYSHSQLRQVYTGGSAFNPPNRVQVNTDEVDYQSTIKVLDNWTLTPGATLTNQRLWRYNDSTDTRDINLGDASAAVFLQSDLEILKNWNFVSSARFEHYSDFGNPMTYRVGSSYRIPTINTLVHASYGTAFAPPDPQDLALVFFGNPDLGPVTSRGYEVGLEQPLAKDRVTVWATWFHNDSNGTVIFPPPTYADVNAGTATTEGVECGVRWHPVDPLHLSVNYTYMTAVSDFDPNAAVLAPNTRLVRRPRYQMNAEATYQPLKQLTLGARASYVADREDYETIAPFATTDLPNYFLLSLSANYQVNQYVTVFARMDNATNAQYEESFGYPALDRAVYGGVKFTY